MPETDSEGFSIGGTRFVVETAIKNLSADDAD